jgi:hypothetical protein
MSEQYQITHRGISEVDASFYMSIQENLNRWGEPIIGRVGSFAASPQNRKSMMSEAAAATTTSERKDDKPDSDEEIGVRSNGGSVGMDLSGMDIIEEEEKHQRASNREKQTESFPSTETSTLLPDRPKNGGKNVVLITPEPPLESDGSDDDDSDGEEHCCVTFIKVVQRCLQPPVIGALLGLFIASFPRLRGIFVDIYDRNGSAPLQWFFDGLYAAGLSAVPINMIILGSNLSASYMLDANAAENKSKFFSPKASLLVVIGKMVSLISVESSDAVSLCFARFLVK